MASYNSATDSVEVDTLYIHAKRAKCTSLKVDLETLLILNIYKLCDIGNVKLVIVVDESIPEPTFNTCHSNFNLVSSVDAIVKYVKWPAIQSADSRRVVAGLCSVARQLIKSSQDENSQFLLGFRKSCLSSCSESSIWTKFCEIDMVNAVKSYLCHSNLNESKDTIEIPDDLMRFEYHMQQPVRMHNVYKVARERQGDNTINSSTAIADLKIPHCYAEGPYLTLADIILLPSIEILCAQYTEEIIKEYLPLTFVWLTKMREDEKYPIFNMNLQPASVSPHKSVCFNKLIKKQSLYSSDPNRYNPQSRIFTKQNGIEIALSIFNNSLVPIESTPTPFGHDIEYDWNTIPMILRPEGGALPKKRSKRKEEQLENLVKAVLKIVQDENGRNLKIVDFCSGSGHLGLLLAYLLPDCEIILVENKEKSLQRALERIKKLEMKNVVVLQSNLDYFNAAFDIGVSLHACGVATDLVMQNCIENKAHFVCCPCCYGGIRDCYHLKFPRSLNFVESVTVKEYFKIAHAADQTHDRENAKTAQGYKCMDIIDTDRRLYAIANNYDVQLSKLFPETCTPKNNLLVGVYKK